MAGILIFILKLVGWLLVIVLCLLLVVAGLLLFLPVPYHLRIQAKQDEPPAFTAWVFGFRVFPMRERGAKKKRTGKGKKADGQENSTEPSEEPSGKTAEQPRDNASGQEAAAPKSEAKASESAKGAAQAPKAENQTKKTAKNKGKPDRRQTLQKLHHEFTDEGNRRALSHVLSEFAYLLRHFGPRKVKGELSFSLGDPANTGYATAALSLCPFVYNGCGIYPDFASEKPYVLGQLDVRGHVRLIHALHSGLGLLLDKDIRKLIHKVRK
jgi:hypothetical protein